MSETHSTFQCTFNIYLEIRFIGSVNLASSHGAAARAIGRHDAQRDRGRRKRPKTAVPSDPPSFWGGLPWSCLCPNMQAQSLPKSVKWQVHPKQIPNRAPVSRFLKAEPGVILPLPGSFETKN